MSFFREQFVRPAAQWLARDYPALAVDVFRVLVGVLSITFFIRLLVEFPEISHPSGLIDHALTQRIHWFTRVGLFHPWTPAWVIAGAYALGVVLSAAILVGFRIRTAAVGALVIAASAYRWNFVAMYLDDAVVHLMLFWMILLPAGRTLTVERMGDGSWRNWGEERVSGVAVRALLINVCWIYFIAGIWKLDSIMWREGFGLFAAMKVEVARMPDVWNASHLPFLRFSDYLVLVVEPILPLPMLLGGRWLRTAGAASFVVFNLFILTTLGIAWAILGLTCTIVLFLGEDLARAYALRFGPASEVDDAEASPPDKRGARRFNRTERAAVTFLLVLMTATARHIPVFGSLNEPAYAALWMVGVAQDYRLFNWIDRVAFRVRSDFQVTGPDGEALALPDGAYPNRFRARLLQAYAHDIRWLLLPDEDRFALRLSIAQRHASWICRAFDDPGTRVSIVSTIAPIQPDNLDLTRFRTLRLADFECVAPGSVSPEEGGVPVPAGWPHLQARFIQGLQQID